MLRLISGALILALTVPAIADQPSYNLIDGSFQTVEFDLGGGVEVDGDGFGIGGSYVVADNWHIGGNYSSIGLDFGIDLNQLVLGGGYHTGISDTTSAFFNLAWVNAEIDTGALLGSIDDDGYGIEVGLRSNVTERVELSGSISFVDFGNGGDNTTLGGSAWYDFDAFAIGLLASFDEDVTSFGIGGRAYFGQ